MSRIAVLFPPLGLSRDFIDYPYFADLGAVQVAPLLEAHGHQTFLVDALAMPGATLIDQGGGRGLLGAPLGRLLESLPAADVVIAAYTPFHRPPARDPLLGELLAAVRARQPEVPVVLADLYQGGQHYVDAPSGAILAAYPEVDVLLRYEAESRLPALVGELSARGRPGVARAEHGEEVEDLDALPSPDWARVDLNAYFAMHQALIAGLGRPRWAFPIDARSLPLVTSRGCPFRCIHCSSNPGLPPGAPKRQRRLGRESMARRLDALVAAGADRVHVLDELANVNEGHFDDLLELLRERELAFEIPNGLRADYVLPRHLESMRGRITTLSVSAESGVQRVVSEVVEKQLDLSAIVATAETAHAAGIPLLVHFMIGLPGETRAEINATLAFALELHQRFDAQPSVQFATPLPGTRLAELVAASGRALPVVSDFGPCFQQQPLPVTDAASAEDLARFKDTFERRLRALADPPRAVVHVTYQCNSRCLFCTTGTRAQIAPSSESLREIMQELRQRGVVEIAFDGGEPTLREDLFELIGFARTSGFERIAVTTNGRRAAYSQYAAALARSGATSLCFSVHGATSQSHGAIVGVSEGFDQTLAGMRNVRLHAPPDLRLGATVTPVRETVQELGAIAALVHDAGLRELTVRCLEPFGPDTTALSVEPTRLADAVRALIDQWRDRLRLRVASLPACYLPGSEAFLTDDELVPPARVVYPNREGVNLSDWLRTQREHRQECAGCTHRTFCSGFWRTGPAPEPPWLRSEALPPPAGG